MTRFLPYSERPELPSRAEVWSILLGSLPAAVLLASAFRLAAFARSPLADDENAYRSAAPVIGALVAEKPGEIVVRPEPKAAAVRHRHHPRAAAALAPLPRAAHSFAAIAPLPESAAAVSLD